MFPSIKEETANPKNPDSSGLIGRKIPNPRVGLVRREIPFLRTYKIDP